MKNVVIDNKSPKSQHFHPKPINLSLILLWLPRIEEKKHLEFKLQFLPFSQTFLATKRGEKKKKKTLKLKNSVTHPGDRIKKPPLDQKHSEPRVEKIQRKAKNEDRVKEVVHCIDLSNSS